MSTNATFAITITVQAMLAIGQILVAFLFVYRWSKNSWQFSNLMKIREPLARAYCSLSSMARARSMAAWLSPPLKRAASAHCPPLAL